MPFVPFLILLIFAAAILMGAGVNYGSEGDDIFYLSNYLRHHLIDPNMDYSHIVMGRWTLIKTYTALYELFGNSQLLMHTLFVSLWIASGLGCYVWLKNAFSSYSALIGASFFLVYAGKYETIGWSSAGLHTFVVCILLAILILTQSSKVSFATKLIFGTLLYWLGLHFYEILLPLSVLPFFFVFLNRRRSSKLRRDFGLSLLPIAVSLFHVYILSMRPKPIWYRSDGLGFLDLITSMPETLSKTLKQAITSAHERLISNSLSSAKFAVTQMGDVGFTAGCIAIILASLLILFWQKQVGSGLKNKFSRYYLCFSGWLIFVAPLITTPVVMGMPFAPSRLTFLPSLGVAILITSLVDSLRRIWVGAIACLLITIQAVSLHGLLFQYSTTAKFDDDIRLRLRAFDLRLKPRELVVLKLNFDRRMDELWLTIPSKFDSGAAQSLLLIDNDYLLPNNPDTPLHLWLRYQGFRVGRVATEVGTHMFSRSIDQMICLDGTAVCR